ncbi:MAG: hypothetical protein VX953_09400 [Pseudomonadota bacterium]|nr:hypothetical protein [Pseudomonadota bacterium]
MKAAFFLDPSGEARLSSHPLLWASRLCLPQLSAASSPYLPPEFAADARHLTGGNFAGGGHIPLTDPGRQPLLANSMLQFGGARRSAPYRTVRQGR